MQVLLSPKIQIQENRLIMVVPIKKSTSSNVTTGIALPYLAGCYQITQNLSSLKSDFLKIADKFLDRTYIEKLQLLLSSNNFTSSRPELHQNLDLAKKNSSDEFSVLKEQQAISNFVNAVEQVPIGLREQLAKHLLEVFINTANMPYLLTYDKSTKTACLLQNSLAEIFLGEGIASYVLGQNLEFLTLSRQRVIQGTHRTSTKRNTVQLKDPQSYRIKPGEQSEIIQELKTKLLKAFSDGKTINHLQELYKRLPRTIENNKELQLLLDPVYIALKNALDIREIELKIECSNQAEVFDFNLAGNSNPDKKEITLNQKTLLDHLENLRHENIPINDIKDTLFTEIISTLIQEAIHIWQVNEVNKPGNYPASDHKSTRLKDYEDNLKHYNSAFTCLALKGDLKFYYEQPLEYDSQAISQSVAESILEKIKQ